ncbi:MAG: VWA domain-containing protein [Thaumarchaeota archaeon]|nr:VWA domain-containing protein [Nitrososphaerota archaeon]
MKSLDEIAKLAVNAANQLRRNGIRCSVAEVIDAANALKHIDLENREDVLNALKLTLAKSREAAQMLVKSFKKASKSEVQVDEEGKFKKGESDLTFCDEMGEASRGADQFVFRDDRSGKMNRRSWFSYSPSDVISRKRLNPPKPAEITEIRRIIKRLRRRLALMRGRRFERDKRGEIDVWKSIRASYSTFGEILKFMKIKRKKTRTKIILLIDVSGSMDSYSDWLLKIMHTLCRYHHNVECFLFSTRLFRATEILTKSSPEQVVELIWRWADMWGSGTKIGRCLMLFLKENCGMVDRNTTVIIISDGWDTGEPKLLRLSMQKLKEMAGRIVWLNPYADKPGYKPLTIGMLTALPYIDIFAGISVLDDLSSFNKFFGKSLKPLKRGEKLGLPKVLRKPLYRYRLLSMEEIS